jgi:large subunit ribosomal protein L23
MTALFKKTSAKEGKKETTPKAPRVAKPKVSEDAAVAAPKASDTHAIPANALAIKYPWITEKISRLSQSPAGSQYAFVVSNDCNKKEAKKLIEQIYGVHVVAVNILNTKGKTRRLGSRIGWREGFKKAFVTLKKGETIDIVAH